MWDLVYNILDHPWNNDAWNSTEQQIITYICGAIVVMLVVTFIDLIYRIFSHFWRGRK